MASCNTCKANRVCDHNKYGFENCNNYISAGVEEVKHGEWVLDEERYVHRVRQEKPTKFVTLRCSECGQRKARNIRFKYCPNCGAIMDNTPIL